MGLVSSCCSGRPGRDVTETKKYVSSCSATGETFENQFVANDIRGTVEIMTMYRAVFVALFLTVRKVLTYRDGWHGCECPSSSLLIASREGFQLHVTNKSNTENSKLRFPRFAKSRERVNREATPVFQLSATARLVEHSSPIYSCRPPPLPRSCPPSFG